MTTKISVIYDNPEDPDAFEAGYPNQLALARKIPGIQRMETFKVCANRTVPTLQRGSPRRRSVSSLDRVAGAGDVSGTFLVEDGPGGLRRGQAAGSNACMHRTRCRSSAAYKAEPSRPADRA
jgi:hypothetical protein